MRSYQQLLDHLQGQAVLSPIAFHCYLPDEKRIGLLWLNISRNEGNYLIVLFGDDASLVKMRTKKEVGIDGIVFKRVTFLDELFQLRSILRTWFDHLQLMHIMIGMFVNQIQVSDCHRFGNTACDTTHSPIQ